MVEEPKLILPDGRDVAVGSALTIGRGDECEVVLVAPTVSRRHARLTSHEGRWFVEDLGSRNGTYLNGARVHPGVPLPLRHADRIGIGVENVVFSSPALEAGDNTETLQQAQVAAASRPLSPFQLQVVRCLCEPWLAGGSLEELPTNEQIAAAVGTPGAADTVKAALRRVYAKAGLTEGTPHAKRRALCRVARQRGWV